MIDKSEGIVLRSSPFSRTSRMVTWLTYDYGRVVTTIKGAARPKSTFLGQTDIGYKCELLFYKRSHQGTHIAREVTPLNIRDGLKKSWRASVTASYLCNLVSQTTVPSLPERELYRLLDLTLDLLSIPNSTLNYSRIITDFEFRLLNILGIFPKLNNCEDCTIPKEKRTFCRFSLSQGRVCCIHSSHIHTSPPDTISLSQSLLTALQQESIRTLNSQSITQNDLSERLQIGIRRFLGLYISHQLSLPLYSRNATFSTLDYDKYSNNQGIK